MLELATILDETRTKHRCATTDDIRNAFGDYHNVLRWLAVFLTGDESLAPDCVIDACTIAESQTPEFHEWLIHWAARATVRCALQSQHAGLAELAPKYEIGEPLHPKHPPLSARELLWLINNAPRYMLVSTYFVDSCSSCAALLKIPTTKSQRGSGSAAAPSNKHIVLRSTPS